ncbi:hypothetical protein [Novosphingobium huizhouense]|uniref:hypothetical protein n=1 Tax=Novosphingobium huizhouense TaxID=2866625 RepID=UPI001CD913BA|nr:hypothetical protein [Novosphingobium huizhouense]
MNLADAWLLPSWKSARPLIAADERFRELFVDLGPAMPRDILCEISPVYLEALLQTSVPTWLRARLTIERERRARGPLASLLGRLRESFVHDMRRRVRARREPERASQQRPGLS